MCFLGFVGVLDVEAGWAEDDDNGFFTAFFSSFFIFFCVPACGFFSFFVLVLLWDGGSGVDENVSSPN